MTAMMNCRFEGVCGAVWGDCLCGGSLAPLKCNKLSADLMAFFPVRFSYKIKGRRRERRRLGHSGPQCGPHTKGSRALATNVGFRCGFFKTPGNPQSVIEEKHVLQCV